MEFLAFAKGDAKKIKMGVVKELAASIKTCTNMVKSYKARLSTQVKAANPALGKGVKRPRDEAAADDKG